MRRFIITSAILAGGLLAACSVPNLEPQECTESRAVLKKFYSLHFANRSEGRLGEDEKLIRYIAKNLLDATPQSEDPAFDRYTNTTDFPKAFRVGSCSVGQDGTTSFEVLLFWRDDVRDEQRAITVVAKREDGEWKISDVRDSN